MVKKYTLSLIVLALLSSCNSGTENASETLFEIDLKTQEIASSQDKQTEVSPKIITLEQTFSVPKHGAETMAFTFTIDGDIIKDVNITGVGRIDRESVEYNDRFNGLVSKKIAGLSIAEASNVSKIGGASLTTTAFKNALKDL